MNQRDSAGLQMTGANAEGLTHFETATHQFRCYIGDPVATVDAGTRRDTGAGDGSCARGLSESAGNRARGVCDGARHAASRHGRSPPTTASADIWQAVRLLDRGPLARRRPRPRGLSAWNIRAMRSRCRPAILSISSSATRACCAIGWPASCRLWTPPCRAITQCSACTPSVWRRPAITPAPRSMAAAASSSNRATAGVTTRSPT